MVSSLESFIQFHRTLSQQLRRIRMSSLPNCLRKYFIERCSGRGRFCRRFHHDHAIHATVEAEARAICAVRFKLYADVRCAE